MVVTVKRITLWRGEIENQPGALGKVLGPLAEAGADLQVVMGYHYSSDKSRAAMEVYPVSGRKPISAARGGGLNASSIPTLLVEGDNRAGLGSAIAQAIAAAGINIGFLVAQTVGSRFSAVIGFDSEPESRRAVSLIKKAAQQIDP